MRKFSAAWIIAVLFTLASTAQQPFTFDAVSIKPEVPGAPRGAGGSGRVDPGRIHYPAMTLKGLLMSAYPVKTFQFAGPGWLDTERFSIEATMPPDTKKDQIRTMFQTLLADRFKLVIHRETRELPMYSLVVAKNGPHITAPSAKAARPNADLDSDGFFPSRRFPKAVGPNSGS